MDQLIGIILLKRAIPESQLYHLGWYLGDFTASKLAATAPGCWRFELAVPSSVSDHAVHGFSVSLVPTSDEHLDRLRDRRSNLVGFPAAVEIAANCTEQLDGEICAALAEQLSRQLQGVFLRIVSPCWDDSVDSPDSAVERLILSIRIAATEVGLRGLACSFCEHIWESLAETWGESLFAEPRAAVEIARAYCQGNATQQDLERAARDAGEFAEKANREWEWANYRLGDSSTQSDVECGTLKTLAGRAARGACTSEIRGSIVDCARNAAKTVGHRWTGGEEIVATSAERRWQSQRIEALLPLLES